MVSENGWKSFTRVNDKVIEELNESRILKQKILIMDSARMQSDPGVMGNAGNLESSTLSNSTNLNRSDHLLFKHHSKWLLSETEKRM